MMINSVVYRHGKRNESIHLEEVRQVINEEKAFLWVGLWQPDADFMHKLQQEFGLHDLAIEDALTAHQRPKIELYGDSLFIVVKTAQLQEDHQIDFGETHFFIGKNFLITVRHGASESYAPSRLRAEENTELLSEGPGYAFYCLLDFIVDHYSQITASLISRIGELEDAMFRTEFNRETVKSVYTLRRQLLELRNAAMPVTEICQQLVRFHEEIIPASLRAYIRDVQDHARHVVTDAEDMRDMLTSAMHVNLALVSVQQNEVGKKLAGWGAILIIPTIIFSMYGMNFEHMPELKGELAYPAVLGVTLVICLGLWRRLKRSKWL
ncbi:magnesium and cobalt transport protein CorA [[Erwinia] mediterraneensis]|uniref:magnesium and cobalt transport protein CorA n=1 Tax=[Erwinia] mediterraneensis TaxID=2161819 RepID=UPI001030718C|nr:magnesium and cobalt transport protein CorA [[Erwinia] mediterraneensis]